MVNGEVWRHFGEAWLEIKKAFFFCLGNNISD